MSNKETVYYATLLDFQAHPVANYREGEVLHLILTVSEIAGSNIFFFFDTKEEGGFYGDRIPLFKDVKSGEIISFSGEVMYNSKLIPLTNCKPE
jgi:hypothetical protein